MNARPKIVVALKKTVFQTFVVEKNDAHLRKLLRKNDESVARMERAHEDHEETTEDVLDTIRELGARVTVVRGAHTNWRATPDLVVTVGGDGTLLATSHRISHRVPLLGINSAPNYSVGFFCGGTKATARTTLVRALEGKLAATELTRMSVLLNGKKIHDRVLNEALLCHASPAATSRYILRKLPLSRGFVEEQRSSGLFVGPAAGSTAAQRSAGGKILPIRSHSLQFVVREPYPASANKYVRGLIKPEESLRIASKMPDARLFLDGHAIVFKIAIGDVVQLKRSDDPLTVLGLARAARKQAG